MADYDGYSRRQFLVASLAAAGSVPAWGRKLSHPRVLVVGAGLAGLCAALELMEAGVDVQVIDGARRVGGRVKTLRGYFGTQQSVDLGAQSAGDSYGLFKHLCSRFALPLTSSPRPPTRPDTLLHLNDSKGLLSDYRAAPASWPVDLSAEEKELAPTRLLFSALGPIAQEVGRPERVLDAQFARYDAMSLRALLREQGLSVAAQSIVEHTVNYNSLDSVSALSAIRDVTRFLTPSKPLHIEGGNDRLPAALAAALGDRVTLATALRALDISDGRVHARVATPTGLQNLSADRVVLAVPFTALRHVTITPQLPADKRRIIDSLPYTQVAKTFVQTRDAFLNTDTHVGVVYSDSRFERVFNLSQHGSGQPGLLLNWINGVGLEPFRDLSNEEHSALVVDWMKSLWPDQADQFEQALTVNWAHSPARGAYAHYAPGQLQRYASIIPQPVGPVHFAGEHTELAAPGMEGALTSGVRAAREIIGAFQSS